MVVPLVIPGPVEPRARPELQKRWLRAWPWLAFLWIVLPLLGIAPSLWLGYLAFVLGDAGVVVALLAIVATAIAVLTWWRTLYQVRWRYEPNSWEPASAAIAFTSALSLFVASLGLETISGFYFVLVCCWLALGWLLAGLLAGVPKARVMDADDGLLGAAGAFVLDGYPLLVSSDGAVESGRLKLLDTEIVLGFVPDRGHQGPQWSSQERRIDLRSIRMIDVAPGDGRTWLSDGSGNRLALTDGSVLRLHAGQQEWLIPVRNPNRVAAVIDWRVRQLTGRMLRNDSTGPPGPPVDADPAGESGADPARGAADRETARSLVAKMDLTRPPNPGARATAGTHRPPIPATAGGPGMPLRWLAAAGLLLLALLVVPMAGVLLSREPASPAEVFVDPANLVLLVLCAVALLSAALSRRTPRLWAAAVPVAVGIPAFSLVWGGLSGIADGVAVAFGFALLLGSSLLGLLAYLVLVRPRAADLAASPVTVVFRLTGARRAHLRLQADRVVLRHRQRVGRSAGDVAVGLNDIDLLQAGTVEGTNPTLWPLPDAAQLPVPPGPALRVVSDEQQWIVPVRSARQAAEMIRTRSGARSVSQPNRTPSLAEWERAKGNIVSVRYRRPRGNWFGRSVPNMLLAAVLMTALTLGCFAAWLSGMSEYAWIVGLIFAVLTVPTYLIWYFTRESIRQAELYPLPPGAGPWGEVRPDHAPLPGWRAEWTVMPAQRE